MSSFPPTIAGGASPRPLRASEQTIDENALEIILVNDGSTDSTSAICHELAGKASNIVVIDKGKRRSRRCRNAGIGSRPGQMLSSPSWIATIRCFLETLKAVTEFFDAHYDEIDVVSYPMRLYDAKREWPHVRGASSRPYGGLRPSKASERVCAHHQRVNAVVKNNDELPRFREDLIVHEDELFS